MTLLLIDDHPLFRAGLRMLLSNLDATLAFHEADGLRGAGTLADSRSAHIDVVLYGVPDDTGTASRLTGGLRALFADAMLVALVDVDDAALIRACLAGGACGAIPKSAPSATLVAGLRAALDGRVTLPRSFIESGDDGPLRAEDAIGARLPYDAGGPVQTPDAFDQDLLWMSLRGLSISRIAERSTLSRQSVEQRLAHAYRWLGAASRAEAMIVAARRSLPMPRRVAPPVSARP